MFKPKPQTTSEKAVSCYALQMPRHNVCGQQPDVLSYPIYLTKLSQLPPQWHTLTKNKGFLALVLKTSRVHHPILRLLHVFCCV